MKADGTPTLFFFLSHTLTNQGYLFAYKMYMYKCVLDPYKMYRYKCILRYFDTTNLIYIYASNNSIVVV